MDFIFFKALKQQKQRLEVKLEREKLLLGQLPELSLKILKLVKSRGRIIISDVVVLTEANRNTIKKHLGSTGRRQTFAKAWDRKAIWYSLG